MTADVAVIIAAYNAEDTIGAAIRSALEQSVPVQVIVVDDASTDGTVQAAYACDDGSGRLLILEQSENQGPSAARNRAIDHADAPWVTVLDADDRMSPERLGGLLEFARVYKWDFVADDLYRLDDWAQPDMAERHWKDVDFGVMPLRLERFTDENDPRRSGHGRELGFIKPLMRVQFLKEKGVRYDEALRLGEDFVLYAQALASGARFGLVDPLGYYAFDTPGSLSKSHNARDLHNFHKAVTRLAALPGLDPAGRAALKRQASLSHKRWAWARQIEAVRRRDPFDFLGAFIAPPSVIVDLVGRLAAHFRGDYKETG